MAREVVYVDWWDMHPCHGCKKGHDHIPEMVKAWLCDDCGLPYVPKHWEERYKVCQPCNYGFERAVS